MKEIQPETVHPWLTGLDQLEWESCKPGCAAGWKSKWRKASKSKRYSTQRLTVNLWEGYTGSGNLGEMFSWDRDKECKLIEKAEFEIVVDMNRRYWNVYDLTPSWQTLVKFGAEPPYSITRRNEFIEKYGEQYYMDNGRDIDEHEDFMEIWCTKSPVEWPHLTKGYNEYNIYEHYYTYNSSRPTSLTREQVESHRMKYFKALCAYLSQRRKVKLIS